MKDLKEGFEDLCNVHTEEQTTVNEWGYNDAAMVLGKSQFGTEVKVSDKAQEL